MKRVKILFFLIVPFFFACEINPGTNDTTDNPGNKDTTQTDLNESNVSLAKAINDYRIKNGLQAITVSKSLTIVANTHVKDLGDNQPVQGNCNLHSWSGKGTWSECCYTDNHANAECMWSKPRELTSYTSEGYEIAAWSSNSISESLAVEMWKESSGHNNVILNKDIWKDMKWNAMGAAMYKGYAVVWFGTEIDTSK